MGRRTIQEYLDLPNEWPIKENIRHNIVLMPNVEDISHGEPGSPTACALHNAACRVFGAPNCAIGGRWAYIPQKDKKGNWYIARMQATHMTRKALRVFDKTGVMPENGFEFIPIAKSHTFQEKRAYNRSRAAAPAQVKKKPSKKRPQTKRMKPTRVLPKFAPA